MTNTDMTNTDMTNADMTNADMTNADMANTEKPETTNIILYGHPTCPMMPPVLGMLKQSSVEYDYINIHQDMHARERVREINDGYESVPTLVFPDGTTLTEPSSGELRGKLESLGYDVPFMARVLGNLPKLLMAAVFIWFVLAVLGIL